MWPHIRTRSSETKRFRCLQVMHMYAVRGLRPANAAVCYSIYEFIITLLQCVCHAYQALAPPAWRFGRAGSGAPSLGGSDASMSHNECQGGYLSGLSSQSAHRHRDRVMDHDTEGRLHRRHQGAAQVWVFGPLGLSHIHVIYISMLYI